MSTPKWFEIEEKVNRPDGISLVASKPFIASPEAELEYLEAKKKQDRSLLHQWIYRKEEHSIDHMEIPCTGVIDEMVNKDAACIPGFISPVKK